jgi:acid phosphatase
VIPYTDCQDGPGYSCSLENYSIIVGEQLVPDLVQQCNLTDSVPQYVDFYWNYNTTQDLNYPNGTIPYAATTNWV